MIKLKVIGPKAKGFYKMKGETAIHFDLRTGQTLDAPKERAPELVGGGCFEYVDKRDIEVVKKRTKGEKPEGKTHRWEVSILREDLEKLDKIGPKRAADITAVYPTEELLKEAIRNGDKLPFDDNIERKLIKTYGGKK